MKKLRVTWKKSTIGAIEPHRRTIAALGLRRLHQTVEKDDTPAIRGMIASVSYLVEVEEVSA